MKREVGLFGDSWGGGEWALPDTQNILSTNIVNITHKGIEQYFKDIGHTVFNFSKAAGSNLDSIDKLKKFLNARQNNPIVLFIVTDPLRNYQPDYTDFKQRIVDSNGLFELKQQTLVSNLHTLNEIGKTYNQTFYLIGGLGTVPDVSGYSNLYCVCRSWPEFMLKEQYQHVDFENFGLWEGWLFDGELINTWFCPKNLQQFDPVFADKLVQQLEQLNNNQDVFEHPLFYPDKAHPNREAHLILFNYIRKTLEI